MNQQQLKLSKDQFILRIVLILPIIFLLAGPIILVPAGQNLIPCAFYESTGLSCPGCGLTRSFYATSSFNFQQAFSFHLLGPLIMLGLLLGLFKLIYEIISKRKLKLILLKKRKKLLLLSFIMLWFGFWIYRIGIESGIL